jgi:broad specificity phosphatase PhoE
LKLILVRHGETHWNKDGLIQGADSDIELNDTGLEQARRLAVFLRNEPITTVLSSPLRRAIATAEVIAGEHQLPVKTDEGLKELKVGDLEGVSISNLSTTFSRFLLKWWQDGEAMKLPNGESLVDLQQRVWKAIDGLMERQKTGSDLDTDGTAVVVSHYFVTLAIILKALDLPLEYFIKFKLDLGGVSILEFRDYGARLVTFNDTSY